MFSNNLPIFVSRFLCRNRCAPELSSSNVSLSCLRSVKSDASQTIKSVVWVYQHFLSHIVMAWFICNATSFDEVVGLVTKIAGCSSLVKVNFNPLLLLSAYFMVGAI